MKKNSIIYLVTNLFFNLFEIISIVILGIFFNIQIEHIFAIFAAFIINKLIFGKSMHYKDWKLCLLWSVLLFCSYFLLSKIDIKIALLGTITFVFFTQKTNIPDLNNLFFWGGNLLNKEVFDWVKFNQDNELLCKYEKDLYNTDREKYYIFKYRFREFKTYDVIAELMGKEKQRISEEIKIMSHFIEYSIRLRESE